jgi:hypothetical protein
MTFMQNYIVKLLEGIIKDVKDGNCSDEELSSSLAKFNPETNDYIKEDDYINADKAMRILGLGYNRNKFFALTKQYGIENKKINNMKIGFNRKEIEELACKLKTKH